MITALGVGVTLLAFLTLRTLVATWYSVNQANSSSDQFEVRHKISIAFPIYRRMAERIRAIPGVEEVSALIWFTGNYKDERRRFGQLAVEPTFFDIHPEYAAPADQMASYLADLSGALVGVELAKKYGWQLGDKITLTGTLFPGEWDLTLRAIYPGEDAPDQARLYMHYKHLNLLDERAHRLVVKASPAAANKIDAVFANSGTPTRTESQLSVQQSWASWSIVVTNAIHYAGALVLAVLMLVLGNAMAMAARDATREYAAMRAIGYRSRHVMAIVMAEGVVIALAGVALGLVVAPSALRALAKLLEQRLGGSWQLALDPGVTLIAAATGLVASMIASALPAWRSGHLPIAEALKRTT